MVFPLFQSWVQRLQDFPAFIYLGLLREINSSDVVDLRLGPERRFLNGYLRLGSGNSLDS
jgi:hypothetical protein